jgi:hypothetical protein
VVLREQRASPEQLDPPAHVEVLETMDLRVTPEHQELLAELDLQGQRDRLDYLEIKVLRVNKGLQDHQVPLEARDKLDCRDLPVILELLDFQDHKVTLDSLVRLDQMVKEVLMVKQEHLELLEVQESRVSLDILDSEVILEILDLLESRDHRVRPDRSVPWDCLE